MQARRTPIKLAAFGVVLALLFGVGVAAGELVGPEPQDDAPAHGADAAHEAESKRGAVDAVRGLASAAHGMRIVVDTPDLRRGANQRLAFRILDARGAIVRDFDVAHEKRMHLILVRRDLTGFQHLHPRQRADGSWSTTARLDDAGSYRLFADFTRNGRPETLAGDVRVDGDADLRALPAPATTARDGGYAVRLREAGDVLHFSVTRDGTPVTVDPYLGARGHLVALRDGDLAFLHVHPEERDGAIAFATTFPTSGRYRLFLQFKHAGRVHTVAFTKDVR